MKFRWMVWIAVTVVCTRFAGAQWTEPTPDTVSTTDRVGIGVTAPTQALEVNGNIRSVPTTGSFSVGGVAPEGYPFFATNSTSGKAAALQLHSNYSLGSTSFVGNFGQFGTFISHNRDPQNGAFVDLASSPVDQPHLNSKNAVQIVIGDTYVSRQRLFAIANYPGGVETYRLIIKDNGNVGIGPAALNPQERLHVDGNIHVTGNINAKYQDIAEWVPSSTDLAPGTVVVLDAKLGNGVTTATSAYDTKVAGVVSEQPGLVLGEASALKEQIATTGRVRVKVDARYGAINVGDLLVTSDSPGAAMKSMPVDVGGISIHRPGTIVGKALEAQSSGEGEILVLLSLQ